MFEDRDEFFDDATFWQNRSEEAEQIVCDLVEWIENMEDELYFDEEALTMIARAKEVATRA